MAENASPTNQPADRPFIIARTVDAPRPLVYRVWTDPNHLTHWWGPKGINVLACRIDLRPGGVMHYGLRAPDGGDMWGRWVFREIVAPERLVFISSFSDSAGGLAPPPFVPEWPLEILSTVTFTEQGGKTTITVEWVPHNATEVARKTFADGHASMQQGWGGTFDQLAVYLQNATQGAAQ